MSERSRDRSLIRVTFINPDFEDDSLTVDLLLEADRKVVREYQSYGVWGNATAGYVWPFVISNLVVDGGVELDFGFGPETEARKRKSEKIRNADRFGWTDLTDKRITFGEYVMIRYHGVNYTFRIKSAVNRLTLEPFSLTDKSEAN